jgi:5-methylcytosine-specific restriction endonuclease McrA
MSNNKEYMKKYMLERYYKRKKEVIEYLGGVCKVCGATEKLEIDHKDPYTKNFVVSKALAGWSKSRLMKEVEKCQLLCTDCHRKKTRKELSIRFNQREVWEHGTLAGLRYCKCELCLDAKRRYNKEYTAKNKK